MQVLVFDEATSALDAESEHQVSIVDAFVAQLDTRLRGKSC